MSPKKAPKKKGGARPGSGRKKRAAPVDVIDGRTVTGKDHAQQLIDQLNAIDPEIIEHRALRPSDGPYTAPKDATSEQCKEIEELESRRQLAIELKAEADAKWDKLSYEVQGWALVWFASRTALETRKYLYDRAKGKAVITVNHLHDKPQEHIVTLSLSERFRLAIVKGEERVRNGRAS